MLNKSQTLASWSREQVDSVNRLKGAWERLGSLINNHQHIMAKQVRIIFNAICHHDFQFFFADGDNSNISQHRTRKPSKRNRTV